MRILTVVQGLYGRRITENIQQTAPPGWSVASWTLPPVLPQVIDYPEDYLPATLPAADLLLALGEHPGAAELLPEIAQLCGAREALIPIDNVAYLPPGLQRQVAGWLAAIGVTAVFPMPFCSLTETTCNAYRRVQSYDAPLVAEFARHFGQPAYTLTCGDAGGATVITAVDVLRDSPCGCARHVAAGLVGSDVEEAEHVAGMRHHHFPCLASMAMTPDYNDTLMHVSGHLLRDEVAREVKPYKRPTVYARPAGLHQP
jgi:hypothetical protein